MRSVSSRGLRNSKQTRRSVESLARGLSPTCRSRDRCRDASANEIDWSPRQGGSVARGRRISATGLVVKTSIDSRTERGHAPSPGKTLLVNAYSQTVRCGHCRAALFITATPEYGPRRETAFVVPCPVCQQDVHGQSTAAVDLDSLKVISFERSKLAKAEGSGPARRQMAIRSSRD